MKAILVIWVPVDFKPGRFSGMYLKDFLRMFQDFAERQCGDNNIVLTLPSSKKPDVTVEFFNTENLPQADLQKFTDAINEYKLTLHTV